MMNSLESLGQSFLNDPKPLEDLVLRLDVDLFKSVSGISQTRQRILREVIRRLASEEIDRRANLARFYSPQELFDEHLDSPAGHELKLSLIGSQRSVYAAIYFAYEDLVATCVALLMGDIENRPESTKLKSAAQQVLSSDVFEACIMANDVQIARLVRNAIAHNGARLTQDLKNKVHRIRQQDDELFILPADNRALFDTLKRNVTMLAAEVETSLRDRSP